MNSLDARRLAALEQAANWYSQLACEEASDADRAAWRIWLDASSENHWAWSQAERLQQRMRGMPSHLTGRTLTLAERDKLSRRSVLKGFALLIGTSATVWGGYRQARQQAWLADYRSGIGERLDLILADGSLLQLDTDSAVDIAYDTSQRLLILRRGELMLTSAVDPLGRPLYVQTPQGRVQALGTRFSVRITDDFAQVAVYEHQVRITPQLGQPQLLSTGEQCRFDASGAAPSQALTPGQDTWSRGLLIANDQRLDDFIAELGRYRSGWLRCDPSIAHLRISGTFALDDTDQALRALTSALPVKIERRTRYWVTVTGR
ncbi:FecR domain-containing protein [Pseudomonas sp. LRF_L74]|uniref:FecR domain-containing protein n=1 Tax=Pseudomonas sp. LRF_L74 TaxID=3369422 RepID=UPI003F5ECF97